MSEMGHYILSVADFPSRMLSVSLLQWTPLDLATHRMDLMRNGGFRWVDDLEPCSSFAPASPRINFPFVVDNAVFEWDAGNPEISNTHLFIWNFPVTWGPELAMRFKRTLVDGDEALRYPLQPVVDGIRLGSHGSAPMDGTL